MTPDEVLAAFDAIIDKLSRDEIIANQAQTIVRDGITEDQEDFEFSSAAGNVTDVFPRLFAFLLALMLFF